VHQPVARLESLRSAEKVEFVVELVPAGQSGRRLLAEVIQRAVDALMVALEVDRDGVRTAGSPCDLPDSAVDEPVAAAALGVVAVACVVDLVPRLGLEDGRLPHSSAHSEKSSVSSPWK